MPYGYRNPGVRRHAARIIQRKFRKTRTNRKPSTKSGIIRLMKNVQLKNCETRRSTKFVEGNNMTHNVSYYVQNFLKTSQGDSQAPGMSTNTDNREGASIRARGLKFKFHYLTAVDRPNSLLQIYIFQYKANTTITDSNFWRGTDGAGGNMPRTVDMPNNNHVRILGKCVVQNQANYANVPDHQRINGRIFDKYIPLHNKYVQYERPDGTVPNWKDIGFCAVSYDANNTTQTDIIGYLSYSATLYFKDP